MRFKSHGIARSVYRRRKNQNLVRIRPSLTRFRSDQLSKARDIVNSHSHFIDFVYANSDGDLKVRFKKKVKNYFVHAFTEAEDITQLVVDDDYNFD